MALADIAAKAQGSPTPHQTCATCHALATLPKSEAKHLRDLLANPKVRYRELADALAADAESPTIPWEALSRHARGHCSARERLR